MLGFSLHHRMRSRQMLLACGLTLFLLVLLPVSGLAYQSEPEYSGPEKCALCHMAETRSWENSPHAGALSSIEDVHELACGEAGSTVDCQCMTCHTTNFDPDLHTYASGGVTCEACHGAYVDDHPENGVMQLQVDSAVCSNCHIETHKEWQETAHGNANVQCIGCHQVHSQDLRLTDQTLCQSCHRDRLEDSGHIAHARASVQCTDCHASPDSVALMVDNPLFGGKAPSHTFDVSAEACANCHGETFQTGEMVSLSGTSGRTVPGSAVISSENEADCEEAEKTSRQTPIFAAVSLGLGIGIGSLLGIIAIVFIGFINQGSRES
ncbi:MAG: multiheme c-type cytochrome [Chloroflexota bacterium]|nr:multiheme c-type cytochrome [Chloroflexota bacterium]